MTKPAAPIKLDQPDASGTAAPKPAPVVDPDPPPPTEPTPEPEPETPNEQYLAGKLSFNAGQQVPFRLKSGKIGTIAAEKLDQYIDSGAGEIAGLSEYMAYKRGAAAQQAHREKAAADDAREEAKYSGIKNFEEAGALAIARGLSLGMSDKEIITAAKLFGGEEAAQKAREHLAGLKEHQKLATGLGTVGSFLIPGLGEVGEARAAEEALAATRAAAETKAIAGAAERFAAPLEESSIAKTGLEGGERLGPEAIQKDHDLAARTAGPQPRPQPFTTVTGEAVEGTTPAKAFGPGGEEAVPSPVELPPERAEIQGVEPKATDIAGAEGTLKPANVADFEGAWKPPPGYVEPAPSLPTTPLGAASYVGKQASRLVRATLGDSAGARILANTVKAASEGAFVGVGEQYSEDVLGNADTTAEKLLASGLHGALLFGGAGLGLTAAGELGRTILGSTSKAMEGLSEEQYLRSIGAKTKELRELRAKDGLGNLVKTIKEDGLVGMGDTVKDIHEKVAEGFDKALETHGSIVKETGGGTVNLGSLLDRVGKLHARYAEPGQEAARSAIDKFQGELLDRYAANGASVDPYQMDIPIEDVLKTRRAYESTVNWSHTDAPIAMQARRAIGRTVEDAVVDAGDAEAAKGGPLNDPGWRDRYLASKKKLSAYYALQRIVDKSVDRLIANRQIGPLTYAASAIGGMVGGAVGHPIAGSMAAGLLRHQALLRGNSIIANVTDRIAALGGLQRAVGVVDREMNRGIDGVLRREGAAASTRERAFDGAQDRARNAVEATAKAVADADAHAAAVTKAASGFAQHAPKVAAAFTRKALTATSWLASQVPPSMKNPAQGGATLLAQHPRMSAGDAVSFLRKFDAVHDPASVLDDMRKGRVTRDQIDALKAVYPEVYAEICSKIQVGIEDAEGSGKSIPWESQKQISAFFGIPASATLNPRLVAEWQKPPPPPQNPGPGPVANRQARTAPKRVIKGIADETSLPGTGGAAT